MSSPTGVVDFDRIAVRERARRRRAHRAHRGRRFADARGVRSGLSAAH